MSRTVLVYPRLVESLSQSPIIAKGDYDYFVHPLSDGVPPVRPALLREATDGIVAHLAPDLDEIDLLLTAEAMGLPIAAAVSLETGRPFLTVRKRAYGLPGELALHQTTGYSNGPLYLNGIRAGDSVAILDDVVSTGGTLRALAEGVRQAGAKVVRIAAIFSKDPDLAPLATELGAPVSALVSCRVVKEGARKRVEVLGTDLFS